MNMAAGEEVATGCDAGFHPSGNALTLAAMCGCFSSTLSAEFIRRLFGTEGDIPNLCPSWNLAPSQDALVVRRHPEASTRRLDALKWGLVPHSTKDLRAAPQPTNAPAETVTSNTGNCEEMEA